MPEVQSYKNHVRFDPSWHFFVMPLLLANVVVSMVMLVRSWPDHGFLFAWWVVMSFTALVAVAKERVYSLAVQDRVIRLEERLRYREVLPAELLAQAEALTLRQMIALRFASDAELAELVQRTLAENLTAKQIKESVKVWRADTVRV